MARVPEGTKHIPDSRAGQAGRPSGPFGLSEESRPMLPGEDPIPPQDNKGFKTTGEKFYDRLQFAIGNVFILIATAIIAYISQFGPDKFGKMPNYAKRFQDWMNKKLWNSPTAPLRAPTPGESEIPHRIGQAISSATVLFWGGALFSPAMRWLENSREKIATWANKRWGKAGEVEAGHERLKDIPKQTWGDVIKGRIAAWLIVFSSFTTFDVSNALLRKDKTKPFLLDKYVDWFGTKMAGLTKSGKAILNNPAEGKPALKNNKTYQFSTILALDLYATSAALLIWNFVSRLSAKGRRKAEEPIAAPESTTGETVTDVPDDSAANSSRRTSFAASAREGGKPKDFYAHASESPANTGPVV